MEIDWIVGIMVFLIFVGWSFSYYTALFPEREGMLKPVIEIDREKIIDFLSTDVYRVPVKLNSSGGNNVVLNASDVWYEGTRNSTKVLKDGVSLPCMIVGDYLYWLANLSFGWNYFDIEFSEINTSLNCDSSFSLDNVTKVIPWTIERRKLVSLSKISNMTNTSYENFRDDLDIEEDFNVTLEWDGSLETYGKTIPRARDVYAGGYKGLLWENSEGINISIWVW
ncbi:MAG: hypothetical protein GTN39_05500 [Candidatus Aenigmarchaeota archaeon]|nr:hypothetical protein [Candidatus Aenigmarchaeota archaeon]